MRGTLYNLEENLKSSEAAERLLAVGGKMQVPCLFIDGEPLYESMDIIKWLEEHSEE